MMTYTARRRLIQAAALLAVLALGGWFAQNVARNLTAAGLQLNFSFLQDEALFAVGDSLVPFEAGQSLLRAFAAGLANTLTVSLLAIAGATLLGVTVGIARLAQTPLIRRVAQGYVETIRNTPLLLQLLFWHSLLTHGLPAARDATPWFGCVLLTNRGLFLPGFGGEGAGGWLTCPALAGFNIVGGTSVSPEFAGLLIGLVIYGGSYISEVVRGSILAVPRGQTEAALAIGLDRFDTLRLVVLPQALRSMVPPMTSQYLNLLKSSSLAVALGYPELMRVSVAATNQSGHALECVAIVMLVYLCISLGIAACMNFYNHRQLKRGMR
jgi:general L-amino acid transport system permease protein